VSEGMVMTLQMEKAISKMRSPSEMGIICVDITNRCNLGCSNCTRLLENQDGYWDMSLENFTKAVRSLSSYPGMIAIIGGNPCMHKQFSEICKILVEEIPDKSKRGLWSNNVFKHTDLVVETFGGFNLNPHGDKKGEMSLKEVHRRTYGKATLYTGHSMHAPLLTAIKDLYGEDEMWERISNCDINQNWSATLIENQGNLRAYFCEVAASFDLVRKQDHGLEVTENWWKKPISDFTPQIKKFCPGCGAAARLQGTRDADETDTYTKSNFDIVQVSLKRKRKVVEITDLSIPETDTPVTSYAKQRRFFIEKARKFLRFRIRAIK